MKNKVKFAALLFTVMLGGCSEKVTVEPAVTMDIFKSPTCGCCNDWIDHLESAEYSVNVHNMDDLRELKAEQGILPKYTSCHTALTAEGYVFEGHVPVKYIEQFLAEKPADAIGLSVPGMPVGSPGMEMDNRFQPYQVLLLKADGSHQVYASVRSPEDQY